MSRAQCKTSAHGKFLGVAALAALGLAFVAVPVGAHFPTTQGSTTIDPTRGSPGSTVQASAAAAQPGTPYSVMFADPQQVSSFEQGGGEMGHKEACGHGSPIPGPFTSDSHGNIAPVAVTIPPSSPGRALICFENANSLTKPVDFNVEGSMSMQPHDAGR
jgi:hypothetical protein